MNQSPVVPIKATYINMKYTKFKWWCCFLN